MRVILMCSGGVGSYAAGRVWRDRHAQYPIELLFADTLVEDADLYRFLTEAAADLLDLSPSTAQLLRPYWENIPPLQDMKARKSHLDQFRDAAIKALPGLHWQRDGRTPWEVFHDARFLGNARHAKCSEVLKQKVCRAWLENRCILQETLILVGIHWSEEERFFGSDARKKPGIQSLWQPWRCVAPLCEPPRIPYQEIFTMLAGAGIKPSRAYAEGFGHDNCSGACVKAGQGQFKLLLDKRPEVYAYAEEEENKLREFLGKDVAILKDRRCGVTTPLPLVQLRNVLSSGEVCDETDLGGCGCFSSTPEDDN